MKAALIYIATLLVSMYFLTPAALADSGCQPIYGGGESCPPSAVAIDKTVLNPQTNSYVDNLGVNDPKYRADNLIFFHIKVSNASTGAINSITVKDTLPDIVSFVSVTSADGKGDVSVTTTGNSISFTINNLKAQENRLFSLVTRAVKENQLPADQPVICKNNQVNATTDANQTAEDSSQFCIEKQVPAQNVAQPTPTQSGSTPTLPVFPPPVTKQNPPTGPELLPLLELIPLGGIGMWLRKKATK